MKLLKTATLFVCALILAAAMPVAPGYNVGDAVADFKLKNVDGKMVSLADFKSAKGVVVIFDCNTCPYSKKYNDRIIALNKKATEKGFPVVAINSNDPAKSKGDSFDEMVRVAKEKSYAFPYLVDETQQVAKNFGATNTPHVFLLSNNGGSFKVEYIGAIDDSANDASGVSKRYVEDAIEALASKKPLQTTKTKAVGCTIKWKDA